MTPQSHGRLSRVASASRNSMYLLTPAFFAFAMAMARLPESMSVPRMRYSPRNSAARAASRALRPDILRNAGPALRRKFAGKARRAVQRGQRRFDDDGAGAAERVPEEIAAAIAGKIHHGGGHGLVQRGLVAHGAVAALVQADAGAVEEDLTQVLHDGKAQLVGLAGLRQPRQAVVRAEMVDGGLFDDGLAVRHGVQLRIKAVALDGDAPSRGTKRSSGMAFTP